MPSGVDAQSVNHLIISSLDIIGEYKKLGTKFTKETANANGFVPCHALGRNDSSPSACVNIKSGVYTDCNINGKGQKFSLSFFEAVATFGSQYANWEEARRAYAKQTGFAKKLPKGQQYGSLPMDKVDSVSASYNVDQGLAPFCQRHDGFDIQAIKDTGGRVGYWPAKSEHPQMVVYWFAFGHNLGDSPATAVVMMSLDKDTIEIWKGGDAPSEHKKVVVVCASGMLGFEGISQLTKPDDDEVFWKVEGLSDMIALQYAINKSPYKGKHFVVTNAGGATEVGVPQACASRFQGRNVCLLGDADVPGQAGIGVWVKNLVAANAKRIRNVQLPYAIESKKGKDCRDFLKENNWNYTKLWELAQKTPFIDQTSDDVENLPTNEQAILAALGIKVIGELENSDRIFLFSTELNKRSEIDSLRKLDRTWLIQKIGRHITDSVTIGKEADGSMVTLRQVKESIAAVASEKSLRVDQYIGPGCWLINDKIYVVGSREVLIWDPQTLKLTRHGEIHSVDNKLIEHSPEPWYDFDELSSFMHDSESPDWCRSVVDEAIAAFSIFDNWSDVLNADIIAAMAAVSWLQTIWHWRPIMAVTGQTNCGKSTIIEKMITPIFGKLHLSISDTTEAGLRNNLRHGAPIPILDEFEKSKAKKEIVTKLFRASSRGSTSARSTADQKGVQFIVRHIFWTAAIKIDMDEAQDRNRLIVLDMEKPTVKEMVSAEGKKIGFDALLPSEQEMNRLGMKLLAVVIRYHRQIMDRHLSLKQHAIGEYDSRLIESYSLPTAFLSCVNELDDQESIMLLTALLGHRDSSDQAMGEDEEFINEILMSEVRVDRGEAVTVSELVSSGLDKSQAGADKWLQRKGLRRLMTDDGWALAFYPPQIAQNLLRPFDNNKRRSAQDIRQLCKQHATFKPHAFRINGKAVRGYMVLESAMDFSKAMSSDNEGGEQEEPQKQKTVF